MVRTEHLASLATSLVGELIEAKMRVTTAESCTGGWIAKSITDVPGSSACFAYGVTTYSNDAKRRLLKVSASALSEHGAVSEATVAAMAQGALDLSGADLSVAVSGIAGPGGGSANKPVGTVWFAWGDRDGDEVRVTVAREQLSGDRGAVRSEAVRIALAGLRERVAKRG